MLDANKSLADDKNFAISDAGFPPITCERDLASIASLSYPPPSCLIFQSKLQIVQRDIIMMGLRDKMKALRVHDYTRADGLTIDHIDRPSCGDDQILIRIHATSVNPIDWKVRDGLLRAFMLFDLPITLGGDVSGIVEQVGAAVKDFAVGDAVHAMTDPLFGYAHGGYAEYVAVKAASAAPLPATLQHAAAAAVPLAGLTAWQALHDRGTIRAGQRVLIHAAAGGVGGYAVQFARAAGAYVIGTASAANLDHVRSLGAHEAIDYGAGPFEDQFSDMDLVIDLVGGDVQTRSLGVLRTGGTLINAWGALAEDAARARGIVAKKVAVVPDGRQLREIGMLIDAGKMRVDVTHRFSLDSAEAALALSRSGHGRGKIVLDIAQG